MMVLRHAPIWMAVVVPAVVACSPPQVASYTAANSVALDLRPSTVEIRPGDVVNFQATVTGTANTSTEWVVQEVAGGTVDVTGRYVAPQTLGTYHVLARAVADPTVSSMATISVTANPSVMISIAPHTTSLTAGGTVTFTAVVTGTANSAASWQVQEGAAGGSITTAGVYRAPSSVGTYHVVATSQADTTKSDIATVTVNPAASTVAVSVSPRATTMVAGDSTTFGATVTGSSNTAVSWQVQEGSAGGSITSAGLYTAPPSAGTSHVVATSVADASKSDTATITVVAPAPGAVRRPSYNTGVGFFTFNAKLYDANGVQFIPRGMNASHYDANWAGCSSNCGIPSSGANFMRVVVWDWSSGGALNVGWMNKLKSQNIAFTAGCFFTPSCSSGTTGNKPTTCVTECVSQWISAAATFKPFERYMLLNIANEWGPPNSTVWRDTYITAVSNLRAAGYLNTIVIDSADGGLDVPGTVAYAQAIYNADPQHNILFAWHEYGDTTGGFDTKLAQLVAAQNATPGTYGGWPVMVEEFGPLGAWGGSVSASHVITSANAAGVGWAAWGYDDSADFSAIVSNAPAWAGNFALNQSGAATGQPANCTVPRSCTTTPCNCTSASDLSPYGNEVILSPSYGLFYARPPKATIFP